MRRRFGWLAVLVLAAFLVEWWDGLRRTRDPLDPAMWALERQA